VTVEKMKTDFGSLLVSSYRDYLPSQLITHLQSQEVHDAVIEYELPEIVDLREPQPAKQGFKTKPTDVRVPARLSSPLIPYPDTLRQAIQANVVTGCSNLHAHHLSQLGSLENCVSKLSQAARIPGGEIRFDIGSLKVFARQSYSRREKIIEMAASSFAKRATRADLSVAADAEVPFESLPVMSSKYLPFVIMVQRLRTHIAKEKEFPRFGLEAKTDDTGEATYTMYDDGVYHYRSTNESHTFHILACGGHFRFYHGAVGHWFAGPTSYLDYLFSIADILNNLDVLKSCDEYTWAVPMFNLMIEFAEHEDHHYEQVEFMKGMEGLFLTMSDYDEEFAMNWKPILETTSDLWQLDKIISNIDYEYGLVLALLGGRPLYTPRDSYLCKFIHAAKTLTRTQCQEVSALHKLIFYAEVNEEAGLHKFLSRVHTPRVVNKMAVKNLTRMAKQLFTVSYRRRHKTLPNVQGPLAKVKLLEAYSRRGEFSKIELLPLSWWDDMMPFDCMDNTLTTDPLEFAKDKGALKDMISFGPGDSRKELLQVIEREKYVLKDFFKGRTIKPLRKRIVRRRQAKEPSKLLNPARAIPKEKEQKWQGRLFANASLENKHSLSLVAAKMKKALSYFDEQLMTPTDRKRKALIHEAARELGHKDNYSLLLDIEGHNQSMQHENTSELSEFIGNLFGEEGWGDLPHYFSQLNVYHYDEYLDDATHSTGQLGGIEGWLNPLWTLHTTLMMKLLRLMTDLTVHTIMVYSDDVDAIIAIPQASEPMVQSVFMKIMDHCRKFGMTVKYSQTTLSKHRITMLRQHYADGIRADSTLKRLLAVSSCNNPVIIADELEVSGICSSSSSALELSNHNESCSYLKNYKLGLLLVRLPHMVLKKPEEGSMISHDELPKKLSNILYYSKEDAAQLHIHGNAELHTAALNDIASYLGRHPKTMNKALLEDAIRGVYGVGIAEERLADNADRLLYLQVYDDMIQDLLFFWTYLPTSLGGLGGSLHINLVLSGHSIGVTKSLHYLFQWITKYSCNSDFFLRYLSAILSVDMGNMRNCKESRLSTTTWPSDSVITSVTSSVQSSIRNMVRMATKNEDIRKLFDLSDEAEALAEELTHIFRLNFHSRVVQFYHENTAIHFVDLLLNKVETSSGLLTRIKNITRLRQSLSHRAVQNIRLAASTSRTYFFMLSNDSDIVECLLDRKLAMFPDVQFVRVEEVLYDDKVEEVDRLKALLTVRRCAPTHFRDGRKVYDDPKVGNETLYKGEMLDNDRMLGHKEELLAAKLVAVSKWFLTKSGNIAESPAAMCSTDVVKACNLALSTLTTQSFMELVNYAPTETGGEILHRIPNIGFSTATYIRSEMNLSLNYTTDLNQRLLTSQGLVDSNVNVDYLRMRYLVAAVIKDKHDELRRLVVRYGFKNLKGIRDVQFVRPGHTTYEVSRQFSCYGTLRGHILSRLRFRYLAHSYMYEENMAEWAMMPTEKESKTAEQLGNSFINDIILRYAKDLDKDYMLLHPTMIDGDVWAPLITKLDKLDGKWRAEHQNNPIDAIRNRLIQTLDERGRMTALDPTNKTTLAIQTQCLANLDSCRTVDDSLTVLSKQYGLMARSRRTSGALNKRLARYQSILAGFEQHRRDLARYLIVEYILTFHFKVRKASGEIQFCPADALSEFYNEGIGSLSHMLLAPDLQFQLLILGHEYMMSIADNDKAVISNILDDMAVDTSLADIEVPTTLPSLPNHTLLTGHEVVPGELDEIEYAIMPIGLNAMATMDVITPLCKFAHRCATSGALPSTFTSFTGSDSLGAQVGLFRSLLNARWITDAMTICDLTAGRGDGKYALNHLGLDSTSYSRTDTFTRLNHHPDIEFFEHYDIFDGGTLKFIVAFDHVHVDISFTGSGESNIIDLVLLLEQHNIQYSIRMNSVMLRGYTHETAGDFPLYDHSIAYSTNALLKPYQIYLLGRPCEVSGGWRGPTMKDTMAFRAMAVSFAKLLSPANASLKLDTYAPNSVSIFIPQGNQLKDVLRNILDKSISEEQKYYLQRYISEVGPDAIVAVDPACCHPTTQQLIADNRRNFRPTDPMPYGPLGPSDVGQVSAISLQYHERHIVSLSSPTSTLTHIPMLNCGIEVLEHFRTRHPLAIVRTWCNILLGVRKYCLSEFNSGYDALHGLYKQLLSTNETKMSIHQREMFLGLKLLVVAASRDCYEYGINYCKSLCAQSPKSSQGMHRTLRIYRLISYLFTDIQDMMRQGEMNIREIWAICDSIEVRERARYKYKRVASAPIASEFDPDLAEKIVGDQMEQILQGFELYAQGLVDSAIEPTATVGMGDILAGAALVFDLSIGDKVDEMIQKLGLKPSGPRGVIDLGDDDIYEYDDF
jgi:hypothetical protein